jgi:hypothetical protein
MHVAEFRMGDTSNIKPHKVPESLVVKIQKRVALELPADKYRYVEEKLKEGYRQNRNIKIAVDTLCTLCGVY